MKTNQLSNAYIATSELLDKIEMMNNELSETFAGLNRSIIIEPKNYYPEPDSKELQRLVQLYDIILENYTSNHGHEGFKNYLHYYSVSAINHIFKTPAKSMELSPLVECLTDQAKKDFELISELSGIIENTLGEINDVMYTFAQKNSLPVRHTPDQLIRKEKGLPDEILK